MFISKAKFKELKQLFVKKYAREHKLFIVEGYKNIKESFNSLYKVKAIYISELNLNKDKSINIIKKAKSLNIPIYTLENSLFSSLKTVETSPGILAILERKDNQIDENYNIIVLNKVADPGNLGTIVRSALWFNIKNIVLSEESIDKYNSKFIRASMGAFFNANILSNIYLKNFLLKYKNKGYKVLIADFKQSNYTLSELRKKIDLQKNKYILLLGNESNGVDDYLFDFADYIFRIEKLGNGESLNLAVASSISFYELSK